MEAKDDEKYLVTTEHNDEAKQAGVYAVRCTIREH